MSDFRRAGAELLRVIERTGDPAAETARVLLYSKIDGSGFSQLYARGDHGAVVQLTPSGIAFQDEGSAIVTSATLNVVGPNVTLTNVAGVATLTQTPQNISIGNTITGMGTNPSILFGNGANPNLLNFDPDFTYSAATGLRVGNPSGTQHVAFAHSVAADAVGVWQNKNNAGYSSFNFNNDVGTFTGAVGYANSGVGLATLAGRIYVAAIDDITFTNIGTFARQFNFHLTSGAAALEMGLGAAATVSAAGTMKLRYNDGTGRPEISLNGAAYVEIVTL